jgi:hypothetical protein
MTTPYPEPCTPEEALARTLAQALVRASKAHNTAYLANVLKRHFPHLHNPDGFAEMLMRLADAGGASEAREQFLYRYILRLILMVQDWAARRRAA